MSQNPFEKESHLQAKLNEYHVNVPDFPMKVSKWNRFIQFLASPTKNPFDPILSTENGILALKVVPASVGAGLILVQFLFFI